MSLTAPGAAPKNLEEPQLTTIPAPATTLEALQRTHAATVSTRATIEKLVRGLALRDSNPEMHPVVINPQNNGEYVVLDRSKWEAKSIGVLNPGAAPVFLGVGGGRALPTDYSPSCPGASSLVLPLRAGDLLVGCDPAVLGSNTAIVYIFRYLTVQPLMLGS